jgi:hypothetical protein
MGEPHIPRSSRSNDQPLSVRDLSEVIAEIEPVNLDYHVGRLRTLRVLHFAKPDRGGPGFMDIRYELVLERRGRGRGRGR